MIAVQLMSPDHSLRTPTHSAAATGRESDRRGILPGGQPSRIFARFEPLDPGIVNEAIPAFFIGRNREGFWVARDVKGQIGGIFLLEDSAVSFARKNSLPNGCATIFLSDRFELDLENNGNPLVEALGWLMRLTRRPRQRIADFTGKTRKAVRRRSRGFDTL
jgi:hypothetical protein